MRKATYTRHIVLLLLAVCCLAACTPKPGTSVRKAPQQPVIYPDYTDITIPRNIAPLNFLLRDNRCEALQVTVEGARHALTLNAKGNKAVFKMADWKELMAESPRLTVTITALIAGQWTEYKPFTWQVVSDELDPCLTYRLIEPDYEIFNNLTLRERCVENFDERIICDYQQVGNRCMNCHTFGHQNPQLSMMYVRGEGGGAVLNQNGMLRKLALKTPEMVSGSRDATWYSLPISSSLPSTPPRANALRSTTRLRTYMWLTYNRISSSTRRYSPTVWLSRPSPPSRPTAATSISAGRRMCSCPNNSSSCNTVSAALPSMNRRASWMRR